MTLELSGRKERLAKKHLKKAEKHRRIAETYAKGKSPHARRITLIILMVLVALWLYFQYLR